MDYALKDIKIKLPHKEEMLFGRAYDNETLVMLMDFFNRLIKIEAIKIEYVRIE